MRTDTIDDQIDEPDETFHLNASLAQGSTTVATASGSATILDNDEPGVVINPGAAGHNINVIEGQDAVFTIQVTDAAPGSRLTLSLADGTALDADYFAGAPDGRFEYRVGAGAWTAVTGPIELASGGDITLEVRTDTIDDQIDEPDETFHLNASLAQGSTTVATASGSATILDNDEPVISISEEGLMKGIADALPDTTNDTTDLNIVTGAFWNTGDKDVNLTAPDLAQPITSGGQDVTWNNLGPNTLVGSVDGEEVIRVTVEDSGLYAISLSRPVDHPVHGAEDALSLNVGMSVTDGSITRNAVLTVRIEDDMPLAEPIAINQAAQPINTNLLIVLDVSDSMDDPSGMEGLTRYRAAIAGIHELFEQYKSMGNVMVNIAAFSESASVQNYANSGGIWLTIDQAKDFLNSFSSAGWTNYDAALAAAMDAFDNPGKLANAQNVAYFLSDGAPNYNNGDIDTLGTSPAVNGSDSDDGIQPGEEAMWTDFLKANDISAYAIGMGDGVDASHLDPIGYNGVNEREQPAVVVRDMSDFSTVLTALVESTYSGNLLTGSGTSSGFGADGGYVRSIRYSGDLFTFDGVQVTATGNGGVVWEFNAATHTLTLMAQGGIFVVNMSTGDYSYTKTSSAAVIQESFEYTLQDHDGDTASSSLDIYFSQNDPAPIVRDDDVITATEFYSPLQVSIMGAWLLWNDSDADGDLIAITEVNNALSYTDGVIVDSYTGNGSGSFSYTGTSTTNGSQSDTAAVSILAINDFTLNGNGLDNILIGDDSWETINGNEGNDVLVGNRGNDVLNGGSGNDWLLGGSSNDQLIGGLGNDLIEGGSGNDILTGGLGSDTFAWRLADRGTPGAPEADNITDFNASLPSGGGDILDLRDLLDGEEHLSGIGNLANYIDIAQVGSDTVFRISSSGGFANGAYASGAEDQRITLSGANLYELYGIAASNDSDLIRTLLNQNKLAVD